MRWLTEVLPQGLTDVLLQGNFSASNVLNDGDKYYD